MHCREITPTYLAEAAACDTMSDLENRIGAVQAIKNKLGDLNVRTDATKRIMDIPALEKKISQAFGGKKLFQRYIGMLENERTMFDSYGKVMTGSRTAEVAAEQADSGIDKGRIVQGVQQIFAPAHATDPIRGIGNVVGGIKDRANMPGPLSQRLGELLVSRPNALSPGNRAYVDGLQGSFNAAQISDANRQNLARALIAGGAVGGGRAR